MRFEDMIPLGEGKDLRNVSNVFQGAFPLHHLLVDAVGGEGGSRLGFLERYGRENPS